MADAEWTLKQLPAYTSRSPDEIFVLWSADLPPDRDTDPALWDTLLGFFEDAAVSACTRPGSLVVTPRSLLRQFKHAGREPRAGRAIIEELFRRGDIVRADSLNLESTNNTNSSASLFSIAGVRAAVSRLIWSPPPPTPPGLDDPIVPFAALEAVAARAKERLGGPVSSDDIHTVQSLANDLTNGNTRDAEAVISHFVSKNIASTMYSSPSPENPTPVVGFKMGSDAPTEADKGILQTKAALQRMEHLASHLEKSVALETQAATTAARNGNKAEALSRLRKKKLLDTKLAGARASAHKLTDVLMAVDEAASNKEAVQALEIGMESLRAATADGVTADRIDAIASDFAGHAAEQEDVRVALQQLNQIPQDDEQYAAEEAELNAMLAAEDAGFKLEGTSPHKTHQAEEDEELNRIMEELGIQKNDTLDLPMPPSPSTPAGTPVKFSTPTQRVTPIRSESISKATPNQSGDHVPGQ